MSTDAKGRDLRSTPVEQDASARFVHELATTISMKDVASLKAASDVHDANLKPVRPRLSGKPDANRRHKRSAQ